MKRVDYSFTESDIDACIFALTHLHLLHEDEDISDIQIEINETCALSAGEKLITRNEHLTANETRILCCCITYCHLVCQRQIAADKDTYSECMKYVFSLNKLDQELCSQVL